MAEYTSENVLRSFERLHTSTGVEAAKQDQWLRRWATSPHMWPIALDLIKRSGNRTVQFYCIQAIQTRIFSPSWDALSTEAQTAVLKDLLAFVTMFSRRMQEAPDSNIRRNLKLILKSSCECVTRVALLSIPKKWPNVVGDLFSQFGQIRDGVDTRLALLLLLKSLATPLDTYTTLPIEQRQAAEAYLKRSPDVFHILDEYLKLDFLVESALNCLSAWIAYPSALEQLVETKIIQRTSSLEALKSENFCSAACEFLSNVLQMNEIGSAPRVTELIAKQILALQPFIQELVKLGQFDMTEAYCGLLVSLAEEQPDQFVEFQDQSLQLVETLLLFGSHPSPEILSKTFDGFESISKHLESTVIGSSSTVRLFQQVFLKLLGFIRIHCQLERTTDSDTEDFRQGDAGTGLDIIWDHLGGKLFCESLLHTLQEQITNQHPPSHMEATIHCLNLMKASFAPEHDQYIASLFKLLEHLPLAAVSGSVFDLIGGCSAWLQRNPNPYIIGCIQFIMRGLSADSVSISMSASKSLLHLSRDCRVPLASIYEKLRSACDRIVQIQAWRSESREIMLESLSYIVGVLPPSVAGEQFNSLMSTVLQRIHRLVTREAKSAEVAQLLDEQLLVYYKMLKAASVPLPGQKVAPCMETLLRQPTQVHPFHGTFKATFGMLGAIVTDFGSSAKVYERVCALIRCWLAAFGDRRVFPPRGNVAPFFVNKLGELLTLVAQWYIAHPMHPTCGLSVLTIAANRFGSYEPVQPVMKTILDRVVEVTLELLRTQPRTLPKHCTDLYSLTTQMVLNIPAAILPHPTFEHLYKFAVSALMMQESPQAIKAMLQFFQSLTLPAQSQEWQEVLNGMLVQKYGYSITETLVSCIAGSLQMSSIPLLAQVLFSLAILHGNGLRVWLRAVLEKTPITLDQHTKADFYQKIFMMSERIVERVRKPGQSTFTELVAARAYVTPFLRLVQAFAQHARRVA
eukprot:CAMPEP_0177669516 /NCGR_PEP_ID=MMETSP0447-20121125/23498_1 /TAXON_ID=0 /ORGANISM="Stygamoeba regulata, Strain BSH-02190019" /LENGTH=967 /DNA_ID=CAMNT_0019176419 /DNA_START=89 /DNA_END=2993 /DNA_ORIENTATION=+